MKQITILCALVLIGCRSSSKDWDSGASRGEAFQQQRMEEQTETLGNQNTDPARDQNVDSGDFEDQSF